MRPVVWLFWWLDRKASAQAKRTITNWFAAAGYNKADVSKVIVDVFDLLYTRPIWGWRAMLRSALISLIVTVLLAFHLFPYTFWALPIAPEMGIYLARQLF